jgi:hypothetical protein
VGSPTPASHDELTRPSVSFCANAFPCALPSSTEWFIGDGGYFLQNVNPCEYPMWFYQFTFAATTVAIVSGGIAGRTQFTAYVASTVFMLSWVYPTIAHWVWSSTPWLAHGSSGDGNADIGYARPLATPTLDCCFCCISLRLGVVGGGRGVAAFLLITASCVSGACCLP